MLFFIYAIIGMQVTTVKVAVAVIFTVQCYEIINKLQFALAVFADFQIDIVNDENPWITSALEYILNINGFSVRVVLVCCCNFTFALYNCHFIFLSYCFILYCCLSRICSLYWFYRHISGFRPLPPMFKKIIWLVKLSASDVLITICYWLI